MPRGSTRSSAGSAYSRSGSSAVALTASVAALKRAIEEFTAVHNDDPKPFRWTATADDILAKIARFAQRTLTAHNPP